MNLHTESPKTMHRKKKNVWMSPAQGTKGQIQLTFNWVYVLIAGAVILLFFAGIVVKQHTASEERLTEEVIRIMESILTGAGVSEKTKNSIDTSGLAEFVIHFDCQEGVTEFGLGGGKRIQNSLDPIFGPRELQTTRMSLWSLPYTMPFKVIDFLFVTSENTKYFIFGDTEFAREFLNETSPDPSVEFSINAVQVNDLNDLDPGNNFQVRLVDFTGSAVRAHDPVPHSLRSLEDDKVTAVVFTAAQQADYYQKQQEQWQKLNLQPVQVISLGGERDAARYAAIFAGDHEIYQCNMGKAFRRLRLVNEVYGGRDIAYGTVGGKLKEMAEFYQRNRRLTGPDCFSPIALGQDNLIDALEVHQNTAIACTIPGEQGSCIGLIDSARMIRELNRQLGERGDCIALY